LLFGKYGFFKVARTGAGKKLKEIEWKTENAVFLDEATEDD
jgi:hypothetical protein